MHIKIEGRSIENDDDENKSKLYMLISLVHVVGILTCFSYDFSLAVDELDEY